MLDTVKIIGFCKIKPLVKHFKWLVII